jgi:hypothetical protein
MNPLAVSRLRCEALINPLAVIHPRPRLSWIVTSLERNQVQSAYAFAIAFELLEPHQIASAAEHLVENIREHGWQPTTGLEATLPMMLALAKVGRNDVAYKILHNPKFPGWNFSILNGAIVLGKQRLSSKDGTQSLPCDNPLGCADIYLNKCIIEANCTNAKKFLAV